MKRNVFAIAVLAALSLGAHAQSKVETTIKQINDRRTNGSFKHLMITLELPKYRSAEVAASRVLVSTAMDDSGRSLVDPEAREPELEANHGMMGGGPAASPATVSVTLVSPERKATKVKEVRGEIELFMPSKDPNSVAEFPKFQSFSGKALNHKALKANGIEISMLSTAQIDAERKRIGEAKRKEYKESGWEGPDLESMVTSFIESALRIEENDVLLRIKDPNKRIQAINYIDAAGESKFISVRSDEGLTYLSSWSEKPQADWKLRVSMKTPKNLVRHSFDITDVPLP